MEINGTLIEAGNGSLPNPLPDGLQGETTSFKITKIFFYFLILSASTFGNSVVAYIIGTTKRLRTPSNILILNLAICDLITPVISIVFDFVLEENGYVWFYGRVMCKLLWPAQTYFTCASSLTLAAISLDRYRLLMHPFKTRLSMKQICILICFIHLFALVAVGPYVYVLSLKKGSCEENWPKFAYRQAYTFSLFLVQYGLPLCFMVLMYGLAVRALCSTSARMRHNSILSNTTQLVRRGSEESEKKQKLSRTSSVVRKLGNIRSRVDIWQTPNARATKMFIVVVVVFAIFMFPNQVVWLWADFGGGINSPHFTKISIICWLFTYTNCVVNPIIFGVFSKDFRTGFKRVFESMIHCCDRTAGMDADEERLQNNTRTASEAQ